MTGMAAPGRRLALGIGVVLGLTLAACSGSDDETADLPPEPPASSSSSTSTSTTASTTSTTPEADDDLAAAEAEIREVVEAWFLFPFDSSKGPVEGMGADYLTGPILERNRQQVEHYDAVGQVLRSEGDGTFEITGVEIDLETRRALVDICGASGMSVLDAETLEVVQAGDPESSLADTFEMDLTDQGWKIRDWFLSEEPVPCEVGP